MHEVAMMKDLVREVNRIAECEKAKAVVSISVWIGALSHLTPEHFLEHFAEDAKGSLAEKAQVSFEISSDIHDPRAQDAVLMSVQVAGD